MAMAAPIPMPIDPVPADADVLTLAQWLSPAYPVGAFAYSHGLEAAVDLGWIADAGALRGWLADVLSHGGGYNDALFLAAAYRAGSDADVARLNAMALAFAASKERRAETLRQGQAFGEVTSAIRGGALDGLAYPLAVGRAAALAGVALPLTGKMYLQAFATNLVTVAQRLLPLGQTEAQRIIHELTPLCVDIAVQTGNGDLAQLSATTFVGDIAAMKHETQHSRIFRT